MRWLGLFLLAGFCLLVGAYVYLVEYRGTPQPDDAPDVVADDVDATRRSS